MALDALRAMAQMAMFGTLGVPITVMRPQPDDDPIATSGIWIDPLDETRPVGTDFARQDPRRVLCVGVTPSLPSLTRGTTILAPELEGGPVLTWRVDGYDGPLEPDLMRVILIRIADFP